MSATRHGPPTYARAPHRQVVPLLCVAVGGAAGALARYGFSSAWSQHGTANWPILVVNCLGAFVLGGLLESLSRLGPDEGLRQKLRLFLGTGFCGAFTTYSTFARDVVTLGRRHILGAAGWGLGQVVLGVACALLGALAGSRVANSPERRQ